LNMGNCCSGNANEGEVTMMKGSTQKQLHDRLFDETPVLGLRGKEKLSLIIKIQAMFKGALVRRRVA